MTLGTYNRHGSQKKKDAALAAAFPQGIRCQKCLEVGHWSYECKNKRKILVRPSRTQVMKKNLKEAGQCSDGKCNIAAKKKKRDCKDCSDPSDDSDSSSGSSSSSDSASDSSSSDSESEDGSGSDSESGSCSDC